MGAEESSLRPSGAATAISHMLSNLSELDGLLPGNARSWLIAQSCVRICQAASGYTTIAIATTPPCHKD